MPEHIRRLREAVGPALLLLPSVSVLATDDAGRVLLVRHTGGWWGLVGGAVEVDEHPADAAVREAAEETGLVVELTGLRTVLGGPSFRVRYANGDEVAYVQTVYDARVTGGTERPDGDETTAVGWFAVDELAGLDLGPFARATFAALGWLSSSPGA
jgi:8-oxo-dGTP pyrophosphatase MutT (NUDIX family)